MNPRSYLIRLAIFAIVVLGLVGGFAWQRAKYERLLDRVAADSMALRKKAHEGAQYATDTVEVQVAAAQKLLERTITRVRTDTIIVHPETRVDTVRALEQLPALVIAHDSLQRACTSFVESCDRFREAAGAERVAAAARIAGLERVVKSKSRRQWVGAPDLVYGGGMVATKDGAGWGVFIGLGGRVGW